MLERFLRNRMEESPLLLGLGRYGEYARTKSMYFVWCLIVLISHE